MKRWIPSEQVFLSYSNKWEDIVTVNQSELDAIMDNIIVRVPGDPKVYKLENNIKRWIETAEAFNRNGFDWTKIAPANQTELNFYQDGDTIK